MPRPGTGEAASTSSWTPEKSPTPDVDVRLALHSVGTAGFRWLRRADGRVGERSQCGGAVPVARCAGGVSPHPLSPSPIWERGDDGRGEARWVEGHLPDLQPLNDGLDAGVGPNGSIE